MSLIHCDECDAEISSRAKNCPQCGYKKSSGWLDYLLFLLSTSVIWWAFGDTFKLEAQKIYAGSLNQQSEGNVHVPTESAQNEIEPEMIVKLKDNSVVCRNTSDIVELRQHVQKNEKTLASTMVAPVSLFFLGTLGQSFDAYRCFYYTDIDSDKNSTKKFLAMNELSKLRWKILQVDKEANTVIISQYKNHTQSNNETYTLFESLATVMPVMATAVGFVIPVGNEPSIIADEPETQRLAIPTPTPTPTPTPEITVKLPPEQKVVEQDTPSQKALFPDNPSVMDVFLARSDFGSGIKAVISKHACVDEQFKSEGFLWAIDSGVPVARLKSDSEAYYKYQGIGYTVRGCWSSKDYMPIGMVQSKMRRKHDNKIWTMDINLNDGSWIRE